MDEAEDGEEEILCAFFFSLSRKEERIAIKVGFWYGLVRGVGIIDSSALWEESRSEPQLTSPGSRFVLVVWVGGSDGD